MNKELREAILQDGRDALELVLLSPSKYTCVSGHYLDNDTFFGRLIRWQQRGESSHSSIVFLEKRTLTPALEIHALEGWGVIATEPAVLAHEGARVELRSVTGGPASRAALDVLIPLLGKKYEKPYGFVTKSRREDPTRFFCSELQNRVFKLQNCPDCFVSPPWAKRSPKAMKVIGEIRGGEMFRNGGGA
jgi:hypothetical protein